ncbi:MAG: phosphoribosyltransferase family protein [Romboutsia sp.]
MTSKEYRESIFILNHVSDELIPIKLDRWGGGEYKLASIPDNIGGICSLYIPYLTFETLEKAYVCKRFMEKRNIKLVGSLIGYFSYSRQERETDKEPELLNGLLNATRMLLNNITIIDVHNKTSLEGLEPISILSNLLNKVDDEYFVVAPDKGAKSRNEELGIKTHICLNKKRIDGQVYTELSDISDEIKDGGSLVIVDDICDGGRTFANAAELLKNKYPNCKIILLVAHAILPFGIELLKEKGIDQIVSTNTCFPKGEFYNGFLKVYGLEDI